MDGAITLSNNQDSIMLNLCPEKFNAVNCVEPRLCQQYGNLNTLFHYEFEKLSDDVQWYKGMLKSLTFFSILSLFIIMFL